MPSKTKSLTDAEGNCRCCRAKLARLDDDKAPYPKDKCVSKDEGVLRPGCIATASRRQSAWPPLPPPPAAAPRHASPIRTTTSRSASAVGSIGAAPARAAAPVTPQRVSGFTNGAELAGWILRGGLDEEEEEEPATANAVANAAVPVVIDLSTPPPSPATGGVVGAAAEDVRPVLPVDAGAADPDALPLDVDLDALPYDLLAKLAVLGYTEGAAWFGRSDAVFGAIRRQREQRERAAAVRPRAAVRAPGRAPAPKRKPASSPVGVAEKHALQALLAHRERVAFAREPHMVVHKAGLLSMLEALPENTEQLARECHAWGPVNARRYGAGFLEVLNEHRAAIMMRR